MSSSKTDIHRIFFNGCLMVVVVAILILQPALSYGVNEQLWLHVIYPEEVAFHYKVLPAKDFGVVLNTALDRISMVTSDPWQACSRNMYNSARLKDRVVLVVRGECSFVTKALNVQAHGAKGIIITNNDDQDIDTWIDMSEDETGRAKMVDIPAFYLLGKDGHKIEAAIRKSERNMAYVTVPSNVSDVSTIVQPKWDLWYT